MLRPNQQRAKIAVIFLFIVMALDIISAISDYLEYNLLSIVVNGGLITEEEASSNDFRQMMVGILYSIVFITSGITFICWFRRAYYNLHLKAEYLTYSEGWAAGGWFVPVLGWFRPYQIMRELFVETDKILIAKVEGYQPKINKMLLGVWWALWIISSFLGNFVLKYSFKADTVEEMSTSTIASLILSALGVPLGLMIIKIVKDYSHMESLLIELKDEPVDSISDMQAKMN